MASVNMVVLMGNLTRDPQLSYTPSNTPVCEWGMAMNRKWKGRDGNDQEEVAFVDCVAFGRTGEIVNQYVAKGHLLHVTGRLKFEQWTDQDGKNRSKLRVFVENVVLVPRGDRGSGQAGGGGARTGSRSGSRRQSSPPPQDDGYDDGAYDSGPPPEGNDIPF